MPSERKTKLLAPLQVALVDSFTTASVSSALVFLKLYTVTNVATNKNKKLITINVYLLLFDFSTIVLLF